MSEVGLGRVKTQRCCDDIEWVFRQATFLIVQASWACSVAIDFGKLFSSSFNFSSFYTARVKNGNGNPKIRLPPYPRKRTLPASRIQECNSFKPVRSPNRKP